MSLSWCRRKSDKTGDSRESEGYAEAFEAIIDGDFLNPYGGNVTVEGPADGVDTIIDILEAALGQHFDGAVGHISDVAFEVVGVGLVEGGEAEADALHAAFEDDMFCYSFHN